MTDSPMARILMVDDSRVMRKAFGKILSEEYDMLEAEDGEAGWAILSTDDSIQLLISDIEMPELDGFGLLERVRTSGDPRLENLPVIFITGAEDDETKERALGAGATDFVIKPVDRVQLLARTRAQVKMDQTSRDLAQTTSALKEEATLDPQTGLTSRKYFNQRCEQDVSAAMRHQEQMALMRINLDNYKKVYAAVGDDGFDNLLPWLAQRLMITARTEDTVSRVGGAEFAVLAPKTDKEGATSFAKRIRDAVSAAPFVDSDNSVPVTVSIGVVMVGVDAEVDSGSLLELAESRVEEARLAGGNRINTGTMIEPDQVAGANVTALEPKLAASEPAMSSAFTPGVYIDQALEMLSRNETEELEPYLTDLLLQILPLLEHGNQALNLSLGFAMNAMRERLEAMKADEVIANSSRQ